MAADADRAENRERPRRAAPFGTLPETSLRDMAPALTRHALESGALVIAEDTDPGDSPLFVILSGRVRLVETERHSTIRQLREGQTFGRFALLRRPPPPYRAEISKGTAKHGAPVERGDEPPERRGAVRPQPRCLLLVTAHLG